MRRVGEAWGTEATKVPVNLPQVALEITRGRAVHKTRQVPGAAFLIGSAADCDLVLGDPHVAEVHCCLLIKPERVTIRHLGFSPGLRVGGQEVSWAVLRHGDPVQIGPYEFRVSIRWPEAARRSSESERIAPDALAVDPQGVADRLWRDIQRAPQANPQLTLYVEGQAEPAADDIWTRRAAGLGFTGRGRAERGMY